MSGANQRVSNNPHDHRHRILPVFESIRIFFKIEIARVNRRAGYAELNPGF